MVKKNSETINISAFKARALQLIAETARRGKEYIITKKGVAVAKVSPLKEIRHSHSGTLKGLVEIKGDIVHLDTSSDWEILGK